MFIIFDKKNNNFLIKNYYSLNILNYQTLLLTSSNNLLNFWKNKKKNLKFSFTFKDSCNSELLIQSAKNNIRIILSTPKIPDPIYKVHISTLNNYKYIKKFYNSTIIVGFQAGRFGFIKNQKKIFVAADTVFIATFWLIKKYKNLFSPLKLKFIGHHDITIKHSHKLYKYLQQLKNIDIYSIVEETPVTFGKLRLKAVARRRVRYHLYTFNSLHIINIVKILKINQ
jgi:hypothetical protein